MTVTAYVMVKVNTGEVDRVKESLTALDGIVEGHVVAGDVDFVAKVAGDDPGAVKRVVTDGIQSIDGVEGTQTYIAMDE